jgi:arylsulfatase A-like enzyme
VSLRKLGGDLREDELRLLRDLYDEEIRFTDQGIGELLARLAQLSPPDRTLVAMTADHGEEFLEHGWLGHTRNLYDVLLRVPLIVRAPGIAPGVVERPVSTVSLLPTLLDLLGLAAGEALHGRSLVPEMRGESGPDEALFAEVDFLPVFDPAKRAAKKALIAEGFKLIRDERSGQVELYDLGADPGERVDLSRARPGHTRQLLAQLERAASEAGRGGLPGQRREPSREELERLQALGYGAP